MSQIHSQDIWQPGSRLEDSSSVPYSETEPVTTWSQSVFLCDVVMLVDSLRWSSWEPEEVYPMFSYSVHLHTWLVHQYVGILPSGHSSWFSGVCVYRCKSSVFELPEMMCSIIFVLLTQSTFIGSLLFHYFIPIVVRGWHWSCTAKIRPSISTFISELLNHC